MIRSTLLTTLVLCAAVSAQPTFEAEMRTFEARDGRTVEAEFVEFLVPERRGDPDSPLIQLAYVRFLSTSENPGPPLVYLAGGPGGSGSRTAQGSRFDLFMAMREVADVIAFDQRGTGASDQLPSCPHASRVPYDEAGTRERLTEMAREVAERCAAFWQAEGV
ncbi:MAG: alpha/beta hydrolase, partial [Bacteroidota bacterium]